MNQINVNDIVEVKITAAGMCHIVEHVNEFNEHMSINYPKSTIRMKVPVAVDGWIKGQFWSIMQYFPQDKWSPGKAPPFTDIRIASKS